MIVRSLVIVLAISLVAACTAEDLADEGAADRAPPEIQGAVVPERSAPLFTSTFEPASKDCNGWIAEGARSIRSVPPRSGTYACKLCADGTSPGIAISRIVGPAPPGRYALTAWTRKRPENAAPVEATASVTVGGRVVRASAASVRDAWDRIDAVFDVTLADPALHVRIEAPSAAVDECVLIDDVVVERID